MNPQKHSPYTHHDEIWLLLPWYVNGSLKEGETSLVKNHLRVCLTCHKEFIAQQMLAKKLQHTQLVEVSSTPSLERLMSRVQADEEQTKNSFQDNKNHAVSGFGWLARFFDTITARCLTAAFALALLILIMPYAVHEKPATVQQFHTVANAGSLDQFTKNDIHVVFMDQLTKPQIETLLKPLQGYIVQGPTASSVYTIRINDSEQSRRSITLAIEKLRANKSVVLVEPALP